jgi:hypothetical protein
MSDVADDMQDQAMRWAYESVVCPKHDIRHLEDEPCPLCEDGEDFWTLAEMGLE